MLKGISKIITPDLLAILSRMGHGDEIVLADANFPGERLNKNIIRCDGCEISTLLEAILALFPLDLLVETPWIMMKPSDLSNYDESVEMEYYELLRQFLPGIKESQKLERFEFYKRSSEAYAVVMTGTLKRFGNVIIKKGTIFGQ